MAGSSKSVILSLGLSVLFMHGGLAGEIARGKICNYDPRAFGRPDPGFVNGKYNCATSQYGENDWGMGANFNNSPGKVTILDIAPPPYVLPDCRRGREMQVLITNPVQNFWVFPRYLDCPDAKQQRRR